MNAGLRTTTAVHNALKASLGTRVLTEPAHFAGYLTDQSLFTTAGQPAAVVRARDTDDVVTTVRLAQEHHTPVVTRGAGTGLSGAANAIDGCIVLSLAAMDRILRVDPDTRTATVQPGVINGDLDEAARRHGLRYAPDPGSRAISTVGGNIATNAGGMCCVKYGVTGDHVAALTAVLADGRTVTLGSVTRKNVAGLDLLHLLVGSEGTLAVIVEATVRLRPVVRDLSTVVALFPTVESAVTAVQDVQFTTEPCAVELMDRITVGAVEQLTRMGLDTTAGAMLLIQYDGPAASSGAAACAAACDASGASEVYHTDDPNEGGDFLAARRAALPALERLGTTLLDDVAVPIPMLPKMIAAIEATADSNGLTIGTFGHAGDGNLHPTIVYDPRTEEVDRARRAFEDIVHAAIDLGGSITGEHGVGTLKLPYLPAVVRPVERDLMRRVKAAFDPAGLLNPGRSL